MRTRRRPHAADSADAHAAAADAQAAAHEEFPAWTPGAAGEDDFAQVAAQARFGVQRKVVR